jgi:hypothetical protein
VALLAPLLLGSCLITSTEDFPDPAQTPPFLSASQASPLLSQLIIVDGASPQPIVFSTLVRSEDQNAELEAHLVADWPLNSSPLQITRIPAGTFAEKRLLSLTWDPRSPTLISGQPLGRGCHPITLVVSHRFNTFTSVPASLEDADFLVWWVLVGDPTDRTFLATLDLTSCPTPTQPSPVSP